MEEGGFIERLCRVPSQRRSRGRPSVRLIEDGVGYKKLRSAEEVSGLLGRFESSHCLSYATRFDVLCSGLYRWTLALIEGSGTDDPGTVAWASSG